MRCNQNVSTQFMPQIHHLPSPFKVHITTSSTSGADSTCSDLQGYFVQSCDAAMAEALARVGRAL